MRQELARRGLREARRKAGRNGRVLVRRTAMGGAQFSILQTGNGFPLFARRQPTFGAADMCLRWSGDIEGAVTLLRERGIEGPTPRRTADGLLGQPVFFRDLDGNLPELMTVDPGRGAIHVGRPMGVRPA